MPCRARARPGLGSAIAAVLAASAPGCKKKTPELSAAPGIELRRPWAAEPRNAVPFVEPADGYSQLLGRYVHEGLAAIDPRTGKLEPALARALDVSSDGLVVRATLRPGVTFHDGARLTAKDVLATFGAVRDAAGPTPSLRAALADLADLRAPADDVVEFRWKNPTARALRVLADVVIVPGRIAQKGFGSDEARRWAPGAGPFMVAEWGQSAIRLARNPHYWGKPPDLFGAVLKIVPDPAAQLGAFKNGQLDLCPLSAASFAADKASLSSDPRWRVVRYPRSRYDVLYLNLRSKALADVRVRRTLAAALDRGAAGRPFGDGAVMPIAGPVLPGAREILGFEAPAAFDAGAARRAASETRPPVGPKLLLRIVDGNAEVSQAAVEIVKQLARAGFEVTTEAAEPARHFANLKEGLFDLGYRTEQASLDADPWDAWHKGGADNYGGYTNPKVDDLLDRARATVDDAARGKLMTEVRALLTEDVPAVALWRHVQVTLVSRDLENVEPSPLAGLDDIRSWRINRDSTARRPAPARAW